MYKLFTSQKHLLCQFFITIAVVALGVSALIPSAHAQQEEREDPIRLVFLNTDPSDGMAVYESVTEVLKLSKDLDLIDPDSFMSSSADHGVTLDTFQSGDKREASVDAFAQMLADSNAETVLALDVFGGGHTMQFVVIGPNGEQIGDVRQNIDGSVPTQGESVTALKDAFKVLVPKIREFREQQAQIKSQENPPEVGLIGQDEPNEDESIKARVIAERRDAHGDLTRGVTPQVGVVFGSRNFALETDANYNLNHSSPFVGVGAQLDSVLALFDGNTSAVGASIFGAYAPFTTVLAGENNVEEEKSSSFMNLRLDAYYMKGVSSNLIVKGGAGLEYLSVSIDPNPTYEGNNYFNLRAGLGIIYQFGQFAELHLDAMALPILNSDVSDGAMGNSGASIGADAAVRVDITAFGPFRASLGYQFKYYQAAFEEPKRAVLRGEPASTSDTFHIGSVLLGYDF